jgi:hypothetical protein
MRQHKLLFIIIFWNTSLAMLQSPYPKQTFELPNHPLNWMCTVHITAETFANTTTSDITERLLTSNREKIIPTLSTMVNRTISTVPLISFFEPCTISVLIDATVHGSSSVETGHRLRSYFSGNKYVYRGWRHSIIIWMYFSCYPKYSQFIRLLPHRLFYHSVDCGHQKIFPHQLFVPNPLPKLININDRMHRIHQRQLPIAMRRSMSTPKYGWDNHDPNIKPAHCLASRWDELFQMLDCSMDVIAVHHYQLFVNFTTIAYTQDNLQNYGHLVTNMIHYHGDLISSSVHHAVDSINSRVLYCDRNSDSPRLRPLSLSSPFSIETWVTLVFLWIFCAIASSFAIFDMGSVPNNWTIVIFIKTIFNSLFEFIMCLVEKDVGKETRTKAFIGLLVICLGNDYKNYLTIELVYPRAGEAIRNFTELLDLNFNVIPSIDIESVDKSTWLKDFNYHLEIDETKREKYVREADTWLKFIPYNEKKIMNELASVTSKNAWILSAPYYLQVHGLNVITQRNYPLSCHFVKRPFAHELREFYFFNPKAEEFKWWTEKFLNHGLFEFWKRLHARSRTLAQRSLSRKNSSKRSNSTSVENFDGQNFIGQVHLILFYMIIGILTSICVAIFLVEYVMQNAQALSVCVLNKFKHFSSKLLWTIVRSLFLMRRRIGRIRQNFNPFKLNLEMIRNNNFSVNEIHKTEVKPSQQ